MNEPDFWNDQNRARKISKDISIIRDEIEHIGKLEATRDDLGTYLELLDDDFNQSLYDDALASLDTQRAFIEKSEIECYLSEKNDRNSALFNIHAGAGGTEAQDWAQMLYRMYTRWAEKQGYKYNVIDSLPGKRQVSKA